MKKAFFILFLSIIFVAPTPAFILGSYQSESEYGLWDGFKFNVGERKKGQKFVELRSDIEAKDKNPTKKKKKLENGYDDYQNYKFLQEGIVAY